MDAPRKNYYRRKKITFDDVLGHESRRPEPDPPTERARPARGQIEAAPTPCRPETCVAIEYSDSGEVPLQASHLPDVDADIAWGQGIRWPRYVPPEAHESESSHDGTPVSHNSSTPSPPSSGPSEPDTDILSHAGSAGDRHAPVSDPSEGDGSNDEADSDHTGGGAEGDDTSAWSVEDATRYMYGIKTRHLISDLAFKGLWEGFRKIQPVLKDMDPAYLPSADTIKRHALRDTPPLLLEVIHVNVGTGEEEVLLKQTSFPKKRYEDRSIWQLVYEAWRADLGDVLTFHDSLHLGGHGEAIVLNVDGVPIGRTGRSQTIVSVKFATCRNVYQLANVIAAPGEKGKKYLTVASLLGNVFQEIQELGLNLLYINADAPMRAFLRNQKGHNAKLGCDYCYARAKYNKKTVWGIGTLNKPPRTFSGLLRDYAEHDDLGTPLTDFGYRGKCDIVHLLPGFDIINKIPVDPMHVLYLGVARCLFELLFAVGDNRLPVGSVPRTKTDALDCDLPKLQVASEFPRRPRAMDFKNWKCSEWRNLTLFFFPLVLRHLPRGIKRQMWLEFCYICRAYNLDDESYAHLDAADLQKLTLKWYRNYHKEFTSNNMRYNVHLMSHLDRIRVHGPFSEISAFPFEGSFAASSRAQRPGTSCVGMQAMRQSYLRPREGHKCEKTIRIRSDTTSRTDDTLIFTTEACYRVDEKPQEGRSHVRARKIMATTYFPPVRSTLDLKAIGVALYHSTAGEVTSVRLSEVRGKLIAVPVEEGTVLLTVTNAQLREAD